MQGGSRGRSERGPVLLPGERRGYPGSVPDLVKPPFDVAPHGEGPNTLGWWLEPCGFVTWCRPGVPLTMGDAAFMSKVFSPEEARARYGPDYSVAVYHDWHHAQSVAPRVRSHIVSWARSFTREHLGAVLLAVPPSTPRVVAAAISTGTMVLRLAGYDVTLVDDLRSAYADLVPRAQG